MITPRIYSSSIPKQPTANIPLCKNCIHFKRNENVNDPLHQIQLGSCKFYRYLDPVSGSITYKYASTIRYSKDMCGINGKNYTELDNTDQ